MTENPLSAYLYKKLSTQMRMILITNSKPKKIVRLDPIDPEDLNVDLDTVQRWSENNKQLYNLLLNNGMAEFLCNREYLNQFYTHLQFMYSGITNIDTDTTKLLNLKVLNLFQNKIAVLENVPDNCKELYLDFNQIGSVKLKTEKSLQLLSISHNIIDDKLLADLVKKVPHLRCLNISHNRVQDIRRMVESLKKCCPKLKILITRNNPISMLALYYDYITTEIPLDYFDNEKYVKPEPIVVKPPEQKKEQKKQQKKDEKKDAKKDTKKGGKAEEKPIQQQKKPQVKVQVKKQRTDQDFKQARIKIQISVLQNVTGTIYDSSIFPQQNLDIKKTQTCFWITCNFLQKQHSSESTKISMDSIIPDGQINRINFQLSVDETLACSFQNMKNVNKGLTVYIWRQQPVVDVDAESGEQKPQLDQKTKQAKTKIQCIGGNFIDMETIWNLKKKQWIKNMRIFQNNAVKQPLFKKPYENQTELISQNRVQFDAKLAAIEQQKLKKEQEQQAAKAQKKGGKDTKKAPAKKQAKKDSKQPVAADKKMVQKCNYPIDEQQYRYLGEGSMYKCVKQILAVKIVVE